MSWSIGASGHAKSERMERLLIDRLRLLFAAPGNGVSIASIMTQYHGTVDLLDRTGLALDETQTGIE